MPLITNDIGKNEASSFDRFASIMTVVLKLLLHVSSCEVVTSCIKQIKSAQYELEIIFNTLSMSNATQNADESTTSHYQSTPGPLSISKGQLLKVSSNDVSMLGSNLKSD